MKTLDEVIDEWARWWRIEYSSEPVEGVEHYLKTYRANKQTYMENSRKAEEARERYLEAVRNCELAENKYRKLTQNLSEVSNDPLTWDELQQMEGKPVWIVVKQGFVDYNGWILIERIAEVDMLCLTAIPHTEFIVDGDDMGYTWQAYRKARE